MGRESEECGKPGTRRGNRGGQTVPEVSGRKGR